MATDGPAALRRLADDIRKNDNLRFTAQLIDNFAHDWDAERAQAAADRAALKLANGELASSERILKRTEAALAQARELVAKWAAKKYAGDYTTAVYHLCAEQLAAALRGPAQSE